MAIAGFLRFRKGDDPPPVLPTTDELDLFPKADGKWYRRDSAGTVTLLEGVDTAYVIAAIAALSAVYQPLDTTLTNLAAANWAANALPIGTGADTLIQTAFAANTFPGRASTGNLVAKPITDAGLAFVAAATTAAETALLDLAVAAGAKGLMSGADKKMVDNIWTDAVADLLCDPTAGTNDTAKIQAWHDALPATGGATLFVPDQCFIRLDTAVNLSKPDVTIKSHNRRTSGFVLNSAGNNGFTCSADSIIFERVRFIAGTPSGSPSLRTAGFAVEFTSSGDSGGCRDCDFIYMWSCVRMSGPLQFLHGCTMREYGVNAINGACVLIDGSGDRFVSKLLTDSTVPQSGHAGIRVTATASLLIDTCQIIHAGLALDLAPANGVTVPSVEVINTYFDTSVVGLNCTGAGSVLRCKFTNSWFGSMSDSGIKFGPTGTGTVDGMTFENCGVLNNVGGTTVGVNITTALVGKVKFIGCNIAGWTTGVVTTAGTNCWPTFLGCNIGPYAAFGLNTTGMNIGAGTYSGLTIIGNDVTGNTTAFTLGALTIAAVSATAARFRILDNPGINPRGTVTPPIAAPVTATTYVNNTAFRCSVMVRGATMTAGPTINGVAPPAGAGVANQWLGVTLEPGATFSITGTTLIWVWSGM